MNVQVKHNGTNITGFVISYEREHKICTGIGTARVEVDSTIPRTFDPWDTIDIHENGEFKVRYYISSTIDSVPSGTITLDCQDISKRLVDYFIPDSYTIDYPSYTRYWIEKFLTEAGIDYTFTTSSQGQLISNNTQLGLAPAYEQILTLLQMSGWYIFFNQSEEAVIGSLNAELAVASRSAGKGDILEISRVSDDKMLRNRALVLGTFDPFTLSYASADVTVHTRWNYDHRDVRAVVISNSNIPNKSSAYRMANQIIKEFARITIEKHITLWGARDYNLGEAMRVNSTVWRGRGLITTFGTSMSKQGLITRVILDERCPRLFGFFDYGDYVYVGTYGEGIWRKHIKFAHTWQDFSSGLTNLHTTDLHINNGVFGSVSASGEMYYTLDAGGWNPITITGLMSSQDDIVPSGQPVTYVGFSGLMGRATIVDKVSNNVKFAIDTYSGMNYGDYFLDWFPSGVSSSGITVPSGALGSGNMRSWIVEYDPFTGNPVGGLGSGIYPVSYSGNYAWQVVDFENDGVNDYISLAGQGESLENDGTNWNFGYIQTQPFASTKDINSFSVAPTTASYVNNSESTSFQLNTFNKRSLIAVDDAVNGIRMAVAFGKDRRIRKTTVIKLPDGTFNTSVTTSPVHDTITTSHDILAIYPEWFLDEFTVFYRVPNSTGNESYFRTTWDVSTNTWDTSTLVGTQSMIAHHGIDATFSDSITINNKCYILRYVMSAPSTVGGFRKQPSYLDVYLDVIDISLNTFTEHHLLEFETQDEDLDTNYEYFPGSTQAGDESLGTFNRTIFGIFQKNEGIQILGWTTIRRQTTPSRVREYVFVGDNVLGIQETLIYDDPNMRFITGTSNIRSQLTKNIAVIGRQSGSSGQETFRFNGTNFITKVSTGSLPPVDDPTKIFPVLNNDDRYIFVDGSTFYLADAVNLAQITSITPPTGYGLAKPLSTPIKFVEDEIYFAGFLLADFSGVYFPYEPSTNTFNLQSILTPDNVLLSNLRGINFGGFFIAEPVDYSIASPLTILHYIDMGTPEFGGSTYVVLQREGSEFNLVQQEIYPIRLDISNNAPVLTVGSGENTFTSNYIYDTELEQITYVSGQMRQVNDYRYTYLEAAFSGASPSGLPVSTMGLYVTESGVMAGDILTYSGGFQVMYSAPSGIATRIETSNYGLGGQYVFITTSGNVSSFYQKDPEAFGFTLYNDSFPTSRATIIRLDDGI